MLFEHGGGRRLLFSSVFLGGGVCCILNAICIREIAILPPFCLVARKKGFYPLSDKEVFAGSFGKLPGAEQGKKCPEEKTET